jgi:hypothetical protein
MIAGYTSSGKTSTPSCSVHFDGGHAIDYYNSGPVVAMETELQWDITL